MSKKEGADVRDKWRVAAALTLAGAMLWQPGVVMEGAARGCALWADSVLPGLLPFMICVLYAAGRLRPGGGATWRLVKLSRGGGLLALMGWITGSPGGARLLAEGLRRGTISRGEAARLAVYTGVMSPMFVLGTLPEWAGLPGAGWRLLAAHWLGALGAGRLMRFVPEKESASLLPEAGETSPLTLPQAVREACQALIAVAGCMALGCAIADLVKVLCPGLPEGAAALLQCGLEVTAGCRALLEAGFPFGCLAGAVSLGGLSLWLQNLAFYPAGLPLGRIALGRCLACGLSLLFGFMLQPRAAEAFAPAALPGAGPSPLLLGIFAALTLWSACQPTGKKEAAF